LKIRVIVKRPFGNAEIEGDTIDETVESLETFPDWLDVIDKLVLSAAPQETFSIKEDLLSGIVTSSEEGPVLVLARGELNDKEAIGLILYAQDPVPIEPKKIGRLLTLSGRPSAGFGTRLSEMRREGLTVKEGGGYRLSAIGKKWVEDLIRRFKGGGATR